MPDDYIQGLGRQRMFNRNTLVVCGFALLGVTLSAPPASAQEPPWEKLRDPRFQKEDDVECTAELSGRYVKRLGKDLIEFKLKVTTKTIGRLRTGRGYATFAVLDSTGKPILTLQTEKYASTGDKKEHTEEEENQTSMNAEEFWKKFDADWCQFVLTARTTAKVDFPLTTNDGVKWFKDNISPEIASAIDQLKKKDAGEKVEKGNWSVWNVKKMSAAISNPQAAKFNTPYTAAPDRVRLVCAKSGKDGKQYAIDAELGNVKIEQAEAGDANSHNQYWKLERLPNGNYLIRNTEDKDRRVLDADKENSHKAGCALTPQPRNEGFTHQEWAIFKIENDEVVITNAKSGLVIDFAENSIMPKGVIHLQPWSGATQQRFKIVEVKK